MVKDSVKSTEITMHLFSLPNEILVSTLSLLRTAELMPLTIVSQRFHYLTIRILHFRLLLAASNPLYKIILEVYLPSRQYTHPYFYCTYLGTDGLSSSLEGQGSMYADCVDDSGKEIFGGRLAKLSRLYSRFRPEHPDVSGRMPVRRIAGAPPSMQSNTSGLQMGWSSAPGNDNTTQPTGSNNTGVDSNVEREPFQGNGPGPSGVSAEVNVEQQNPPPQSQPIWSDFGDGGRKKIIYDLHLDEDESLGQFCVAPSLVRLGPRRGVFLSFMHLYDDRPDVMRVWRNWLIERARDPVEGESDASSVLGDHLQKTSTTMNAGDIVDDPNILWTDYYSKNMGLKLCVRKVEIEGVQVRDLAGSEDNVPLSFTIEIQEFIIRTSKLMLGVEELQEAQMTSGKALIIGNFAVAS